MRILTVCTHNRTRSVLFEALLGRHLHECGVDAQLASAGTGVPGFPPMPEVVEFYRIAGEVDYLLKLQVADIAAYDRAYKTLIRSAKLADVSASFAMETMKCTTAVPLPAKV